MSKQPKMTMYGIPVTVDQNGIAHIEDIAYARRFGFYSMKLSKLRNFLRRMSEDQIV